MRRIRTRVRELARQKGVTMSDIARDARLTMTIVRRAYYSTSNGSEHGPPLTSLEFSTLAALAAYFECAPGDLLEWSEE